MQDRASEQQWPPREQAFSSSNVQPNFATASAARVCCLGALLRPPDWCAAAEAYAEEHDRYFHALRRIHGWYGDLWYRGGADADALRARALPRIAEDSSRLVDFIALGPEAPSDEAARSRMFGED